uniref:LEM domain-containing protein n=1 Tax=Steinernema glaseri TaxID=37863 RepID=A0A1I7Z9U2_9BILA
MDDGIPMIAISETHDILVLSSLLKLRKLCMSSHKNDPSKHSPLARALLINSTIACLLQNPDPRYQMPWSYRVPPPGEDVSPELENWVQETIKEIDRPRTSLSSSMEEIDSSEPETSLVAKNPWESEAPLEEESPLGDEIYLEKNMDLSMPAPTLLKKVNPVTFMVLLLLIMSTIIIQSCF